MEIRVAKTDTEIAACYPVIHTLRPHIKEEHFLVQVRTQEKTGYRLVLVLELAGPVAVAGFRVGESLSWGRFLYVDDLVTLEAHRRKGYGSALLSWLQDYADKEGCLQMHLDSRVQREGAHRFYERQGMKMVGYHFSQEITSRRNSVRR
ncbi:MAG: GNAT family N-acetyltransferase [Acidiferrobacteraceae bacterium]